MPAETAATLRAWSACERGPGISVARIRSWRERQCLSVLHPPRGAVALGLGCGEQVEEGLRRQGLGPEHAAARPGAVGQELQRDDGVDRGLPDHALRAVVAHRVGVVDDVEEVRRPGRAVLAGAGDEEPGARLALHPRPDRGRVGQARRHHVAGRDLHALDRHRLGRVEAERVQGAEDADHLLAQAVLEGDPVGLDPARHEEHLLVLDVHALDGPDALGEVEHLGLGEGRQREEARPPGRHRPAPAPTPRAG